MSMMRTLLSLAAAAAMLSPLAMATNFTVGGPTGGWDTTTDLQTWASSQIFSVGDNLFFQYTPNHNLLEVTKAYYDSCRNSDPIQMYAGGTTHIPLVSSGTRYFICGTSGHCSQGMKVKINTLSASTAPPPASPPATPTPTPPPASPPATPPPLPLASPPATPTPPPPASPPATPTPPHVSPPAAPTTQPTETPPSPPASSPPTETPTSQPKASGGPASSSSVPPTESPTNSPPPSVFSPPPPPFSAAKVKLMSGSAMGFAFVMIILLFL